MKKQYPYRTGVAQRIVSLIMASPDFQSIFLTLPGGKLWALSHYDILFK